MCSALDLLSWLIDDEDVGLGTHQMPDCTLKFEVPRQF